MFVCVCVYGHMVRKGGNKRSFGDHVMISSDYVARKCDHFQIRDGDTAL